MLAGRYVEKILGTSLDPPSLASLTCWQQSLVESADKIMESALMSFVVVSSFTTCWSYFFGYFTRPYLRRLPCSSLATAIKG